MTPRDFQKEVGSHLRAGHSVLQVAPTGLGKTRAAIEPFIAGSDKTVSTRLLYALPLRSLAEGVMAELRSLVGPETACAVHYGERPESAIFSESACITTIDQYLAAFAGAPLSSFTDTTTGWRLGRAKVGHAVAGAVMTSYSVFDEVHLLDPRYGLQLLLAVLAQRQRWGLLSTVSTATLPASVVKYLTQDQDGPGLHLVEASERDIAERDNHRRVSLELVEGLKDLPLDAVLRLCDDGLRQHGKVILFANTVERALHYYRKLRVRHGEGVILAHSRFAPSDRRHIEGQVRQWFGRGTKVKEGILVTTQVAEAGLNISAPLVLSELCPADSLVQRAGRCARFVPSDGVVEGRVVVFRPADVQEGRDGRGNYWAPYSEFVIKDTEKALPGFQGRFDWQHEKELVNEALGERYGQWVKGFDDPEDPQEERRRGKRQPRRLRPVDALGPFERAFRAHSPNEVEEWLRNPEGRPLSVQAAVAASEQQARDDLKANRHPDMVSVPFGVFYRAVREQRIRRWWEIDAAGSKRDDNSLILRSQMVPGRTYLLLAEEAGYSPEEGLTLGGAGQPLGWEEPEDTGQRGQDEGRDQTFAEHTLGTFRRATNMLERYRPFLEAWAQQVLALEAATPQDVAAWLVDAMKAAALFHDVGKLRADWQKFAGWKPGAEPIARFPRGSGKAKEEGKPGKLPHHANFAYPFLQALFRQANGDGAFLRPLEFIALAAARHHTLTVSGTIPPGEFQPFDGAKALKVLQEIAQRSGLGLEDRWVEAAFERLANRAAWRQEPYYADEAPGPSDDFYPVYCIAQRLVKVADWEDAGNQDIELHDGGSAS